jgi:hypothetical protein
MDAAVKTRAAAKGWLTRAAKQCESINKDIRNAEEEDYEAAITNFEFRLAAWDNAELSVESFSTVEELEEMIEAAATFRELVEKSKLKLIAAWRKTHPRSTQNQDDASTSYASATTNTSRSHHPTVKLPNIELPRFSGEILKFTSFWQQFTACVDELTIPDVTKFNYLMGLLRGDAKSCLEGMSITAENYDAAKKLLKEKFGRKELVIYAHVQELVSLEITDVQKLSKMYDRLVANVRSLEGLGVTSEQFGIILTPLIVSRLPDEIRMEWSRDSATKEGDLQYLMTFLDKEISRRERCMTFSSLTMTKETDKPKLQKPPASKGSAAALYNSQGSTPPTCVFCDNRHSSSACRKYLNATPQGRWELVKSARICFNCLKPGHRNLKCRAKRCSTCNKYHHDTLHIENYNSHDSSPQDSSGKLSSSVDCASESVQNSAAILTVNNNVTFLPTARVQVQCRDGSWQSATLLFDSGADRSYVSSSLVSKVGPRFVKNTGVSFSTFGGRSQGSKSKIFELLVKGKTEQSVDIKVAEVPVICLPLSRPSVEKSVLDSFGVHMIEFADDFDGRDLVIDILIGQDLFWTLMMNDIVRGTNATVIAQQSVFGWVLSGALGGECSNSGTTLLNISTIPKQILSRFWDLEAIGVSDKEDCPLEKFQSNITFGDKRYTVGLTWKDQHPPLLDNKHIAVASLKRTQKRLEKDPELLAGYAKALQEMEDNGFVEEVPSEEIDECRAFYLPHHPVVRKESISTKIRPVFNASCKGQNGVSLNDCLEAGPNLNPSVSDVLLRFRRWKYAISADVKKAFLQIKMMRKDQDFQRFLVKKGEDMRTMRFVRVAFGVNCSPFLLAATIRHHLSLYEPSFVVSELKDNLYVDDFLSGADTKDAVKQLHQDADKIMSEAGMTLAKWTTNDSAILGSGIEGEMSDYVKVLGVSWEREQDVFRFVGAQLPDPIRVTKRTVLSLIARVFDPLGFILPCTITARFLFQDVWRLGISWDEDLPQELQESFQRWLKGLEFLKEITIPRSYMTCPWSECESDVELHAFGDASLKGYGACVYVRHKGTNGRVQCTLVRSCGRVAPIERKTLPRLELLACLVTAQLLDSVIKALHLPEVKYTCWSDSMVALGWIRSDPSKWRQWVANRVATIHALTNPAHWKHVRGIENPADIVSRGASAEVLVKSDLWWKGPQFLQQPEFKVQEAPTESTSSQEVEIERKVSSVLVCTEVEPTFDIKRWSTLDKAFKVIAWVQRFIKRARKQTVDSGPITSVEYAGAKLIFLLEVQRVEFAKEILLLKAGKKVPSDSKLAMLNPCLDDNGLLRVRGRIQLSELSYESKHPIILPKGHALLLLLRFIHVSKKHAGVQSMITSVREEYEAFGLRQTAKTVKRYCIACQKVDSRACGEEAAPLPKVRVTRAPVFSVTGIDFAGPLFCSDDPGAKLYICLFVCGVVRAIHLELTESLTTEDFVLAFRRFAALKRVPSIVYSDNGTNFVGGQRVLSSYLGPLAPEWKFNCPRAPWWGGWWERLVRSVKSALKKSIRRESLSKVELCTCLCEVAAAINSRPLTFVGTDIENSVPLTPNHFLSGHGNQGLESRLHEDPESLSLETLSLRQQEMVDRLDEFWKVWSEQYLKNLPPSIQSMRKSGNAEIGSFVLIREDGVPRMQWNVGIITKLHYGKDGLPRAADIRTAKSVKTRPIQKLHCLEMGLEVLSEDSKSSVSDPAVSARPVRTAKLPSRFDKFVM